jgi:ABC-type antimicrobial peptide transport system permease subunit
VTANTFRLIGQQPLLGRDFASGEDTPGAAPVVILGHGVWTSRYGAGRDILGRTIRVNEISSTVIGVMPEGMKFPVNADMWQPLVPDDERQKRDRRTLNVFGRLRDGASLAEARAELNAIAGRLAEQYPETNRGVEAVVMPYNDRFNGGPIRLVFLALMVAVVFVLPIACANVANLLLARSAYRAREFAVRAALVVRQLLAESLLLALGSGALGYLLSVAGVRLFASAVENVGKPYWIQFTMDWRVFTFLLGSRWEPASFSGWPPLSKRRSSTSAPPSRKEVEAVAPARGPAALPGPWWWCSWRSPSFCFLAPVS